MATPATAMPRKKKRKVEWAMYCTVMEAFFAGVMVHLVTGVLLVKLALELGATGFEIGVLAALPFLGQLMQIPSLYMVKWIRRRKLVTFMGSTVYRLCLLMLVGIPWIEDKSFALTLLIFVVIGQNIGGGWSTGSWNGWMRDLIPQKYLGRMFGKRMNWYTLTGTVAAISGAIGLDVMAAREGKEVLLPMLSLYFAIAFLASCVSFYYLIRTPEVRAKGVEKQALLQELLEPLKDKNFRRLVVFLLVMLFAMNLAVPFFPVYMLQTLGLPVAYVTGLWALGQMMQVPFFSWWGFVADKYSHTTALATCLPFFVVGLLLWPLTTLPEAHILTIPLLVVIHILLGVGLSGVLLSSQVIVLKLAPKNKAASYMATATMLSSLAAGIAAITGGLLVEKLSGYGLSVVIHVQAEGQASALPAYELSGYDFLFLGAALLVLLTSPLLTSVEEKGKVPKEVVMKLMRAKAMGMFRGSSTVAGWRQLTTYPLVLVARKKAMKEEGVYQEQREYVDTVYTTQEGQAYSKAKDAAKGGRKWGRRKDD